MPTYTLAENVPLAGLTTFRVPATARWFAEVSGIDALGDLFARPQAAGPLLVLGEGSNLLFTRDFDGLVVRIADRGIEQLSGGLLRVGAGENWHAFVRASLAQGCCGLENLALIPGTVGAAPVQNIGAYGVELAEFVASVHAWDRGSGAAVVLGNAACAFAYRDSVFKREPDRYVVTAVEFALPRERAPVLGYAGVRDELEAMGITEPSNTDVAEAVERLRRRKLPNPAEIANAGSFFKNPVVPKTVADALEYQYPDMPAWPLPSDGVGVITPTPMVKLSAAWLLEQCGFKGYRDGDAGFSDKHALVLVNHGRATGAELWALAQRAQTKVEKEFGVLLEPEPRVL